MRPETFASQWACMGARAPTSGSRTVGHLHRENTIPMTNLQRTILAIVLLAALVASVLLYRRGRMQELANEAALAEQRVRISQLSESQRRLSDLLDKAP